MRGSAPRKAAHQSSASRGNPLRQRRRTRPRIPSTSPYSRETAEREIQQIGGTPGLRFAPIAGKDPDPQIPSHRNRTQLKPLLQYICPKANIYFRFRTFCPCDSLAKQSEFNRLRWHFDCWLAMPDAKEIEPWQILNGLET